MKRLLNSQCRIKCILAILLLLLMIDGFDRSTASGEAPEAYPTKKVLIMYSYNQELPFYADFTTGLKQRLREERAFNVQFFYEYLDINASMDETFEQAMATVLRKKYQ